MGRSLMFSSLIIVLLILQIFNVVVFANSSWVWISEMRPYDILPWVAICTLGIETISLVFIAKIKKGFKVFSFVAIANIISFATPYLMALFHDLCKHGKWHKIQNGNRAGKSQDGLPPIIAY